jgi:hypothetical protein
MAIEWVLHVELRAATNIACRSNILHQAISLTVGQERVENVNLGQRFPINTLGSFFKDAD